MADVAVLFLPLGAFFGWWISKNLFVGTKHKKKPSLSREYYAGLNFLLNEETDKAIKSFIKVLDTTSDSVETTLAIGNFFRKRGEVDRAICLHQGLIAKPNLTTTQRYAALLELGKDYIRAGVYDRAEVILIEVIDANTKHLSLALKSLLDIYEREKEWSKCIVIGKRYQEVTGIGMGVPIANYYCELAQVAWHKGKVSLAFKNLKKGLFVHKKCVRILLLRGEYEVKLSKLKNALSTFKSVEYQDKAYITEALEKIIFCYTNLGNKEGLYHYLKDLSNRTPKIKVMLAFAQVVHRREGAKAAQNILYTFVDEHPSMVGIQGLINLYLDSEDVSNSHPVIMMHNLIAKVSNRQLSYQCSGCGFESQMIYWQCPSCRSWEKVKPLE
jgi:lipopolysaccharide biosynthesis regulator YciM